MSRFDNLRKRDRDGEDYVIAFMHSVSNKKMKRLKSNVVDTPPFKRPICSSNEESIRYVSSIDLDATLTYIREIKETFVDQEGKYEMLVDVMKDLKAGRKERKDVKDVYDELSVLLSDRPDLLDDFSGFLPDSVTTNIMKRLKSDVVNTPPFKQPICSSNEESIRCVSSIDPDATLSYIRQIKIKDTFVDQEGKYEMLVDVMKDLKAGRINPVGVIERVGELFKGYPSLIIGFNAYLPNGYEIMLSDEEKASLKNATNYEQERNFVENIKVAVLSNDHHDLLDEFSEFLKDSKHLVTNHEYKSFLDIMNKCRKERKDVKDVYHEVSVLLNDRPDLLDELSGFLPDSVTTNMLSNLDGNKN
ncbi:paired amphipathic helix protein Sin3-like 1 [Solanum pennellii]|uniref:Paired amphipathic helix protein Sin3-like 1 n=1 Tax=Solanum pennellii TaxID=28526 RepID=A0ABM1UWR2_SOLPN|nr:paired amphipathic helix protein Sin3-like 1 [Solanum pennellii]